MAEDATPKPKKIPSWYTQKSLCEADIDLTDFGTEWGVFPLRDPPAALQSRWYDRIKTSNSALEPDTLGLHLQANYGGPDEPNGKWPGKASKSAEWIATAKNLPTKIALRIMRGADLMAQDHDDDAGN